MNNEKPTYQALADELSNLKKENESLKLALSLHDNSEALIANIGDVIGIIGADGIMKYKSPNIEKYFGWMPADLIGTDGLHTVHPDDVERIQNEFAKLIINNNALTTVEYRYKCKNGTYKWIELTAVNNINNPGINGVLLNYHDITERKHAEEVLAQEKAFVEAIFESIPGMLYVYDDKGTHIRHNKRHEEMTGYSDEELSHMNPLIWYDNKADVVRVEAAINDVFTKGYGEVDVPMRIKNGEKPIMHFTGSLLIKDSKKYFVGVGIDITERKQTEEKLKSSDRIFLHSLDMLCIAGFDGYFKVLNPAWEKTLGWSNDELLKNPWLEFVHPDDRNATENIKSVIVEGKEIYQFENKFICKDGGIKWLSWNSFPYPEDGIMFGVARDVTVLKQIEIELIKSKDKAEESEQTFRALFEKGPIGVAYHKMIYDEACLPINYLFLAANESYQKLTGVNPNGKLVTEAFPGIENDPFNWIGTFGEVAKTGREIRFQQYLQPNHRWYDCVGYQYKPDHFVAAFLEITEQKRAENELQENQSQLNAQNEEYLVINEELQEQNNEYAALNEEYITQNEDLLIAKEEAERNEKKYRSLFVSMQEGVYLHEMVYDNQGKAINYRIIEANPVSEKCLNIKREYAIGKLATELFGTAEAPFIEIYSKVAETGEPYQFEQYFEPMNKYFYVSVFSPKKGEFATAFLDITKSKDYENDLVKAKEKAEESENRLKLASRSGKLGIWDWNVKDNIMIWDEKMFELYGITHDAFPSNIEAWTNGLHPDDKQRAIDECNAALNGEKDFNTSFRIVQPNGIIIHLKADGIVIRDIDNKPLRMIGINQDISELKKAEYELIIAKERAEESEEKYKQIFDNTFDIMSIYEVTEDNRYKVITFNPAEAKVIGPLENYQNRYIDECIPPELYNQFKQKCESCIKEERRIEYEGNISFLNINQTFNTQLIPLKNTKGRIHRIIVISRDITEQKHTFERINSMSEMLDIAPNSITIHDISGNFLYANQKTFEIHGYSIEEFMSMNLHELDVPQSEAIIAERIDLINKQGSASFEVEHYKKDKTTFPLKVFAKKVIWHGQTVFLSVSTDIAELKKIQTDLLTAKEKAEESDRLKTAFLQNMSHEIRTPMNAIMGFSELLVKNFNNKPKLEQFSGIIKQRSNDLLDIINDLLDIAKIESGQLQVSIENCNVTSLFSELKMFFTEYQARMNKQHISFDLLAHCNLQGITISTDKVKLRQIIINLLTNAFKFTPKGKIEGGCRVDENQQLIFYVSDTGIGIPQDKHEYIFERFSQLENGNSRLFGGTGLGLPIVKGLVDLLGGKIWFDSDPDKGTTFFFTIAYSNQALKMPLVNDDSVPDTLNFHNNTILIVEDDQFNMALIEEMLSDLGLYILCAENGSQAIEIALSQTPELILMDIGLPDMSGYEAIRQILLKQPTMKIVAQTAYATATDRDTAINSGCIDYISKPLKAQKLLSLINKYLG